MADRAWRDPGMRSFTAKDAEGAKGNMELDRNKSELTHKVTAAAYRYLDERGFKPVETEVPVEIGWVADLAGVISPTQTELQKLRLLPAKPSWRRAESDREAWYALAKQAQQLMTVLVEVKTSCSDFRGDRKWTAAPPTNLCYVAIPYDLAIRAEELPIGWGVLEYLSTRDCMRASQVPVVRKVTIEQQLSVIHSIAVRRDHHTRYERERVFRKQIVARQNEAVSRTRMSQAIRAVTAVVTGHSMGGKIQHASADEALKFHGISNVPDWDMEKLNELFHVQQTKV